MPAFSTFNEFSKKVLELSSPDGGKARISPYAAHVLSWITADGREHLFLSPKAEYRSGAAIRGGVPVIFPQFAGQGNLPKHGFARNMDWEIGHRTQDTIVFSLIDNPETRTIWPNQFLAEYAVQLKNKSLEMSLSVKNTSAAPFRFTAALHTYLGVTDIVTASVKGLVGQIYLDSVDSGQAKEETRTQVDFTEEVDRIYLETPPVLKLIDGDRQLSIRSEGFPDTVVWNPGPEKCAKLADMEPDGYRKFVCVESAAVGMPVRLEPGQTWQAKQILSI